MLEFQKCLDKTEPVPWATIRKTIASDLGMPLEEAFSSIDPTPLATASVAQVHAAGAIAALTPLNLGCLAWSTVGVVAMLSLAVTLWYVVPICVSG